MQPPNQQPPYGSNPNYPPQQPGNPNWQQPQYPNNPNPNWQPLQPQYPNQNWQQYPQQQPPYGSPIPQQPMQPQPPKKKRGFMGCGITAIVLVVVIIIIAVAANGNKGTASTNSTTNPTTSSSSSSSSSSGTHKVGDSQTMGGWTVTLDTAKTTSTGTAISQPKSGDVFLLIDVTLSNATGKAQPVSSLIQFALKDGSGQGYNEALGASDAKTPDGTLANGSKLRGTIGYEVPATAKSFELDFTPTLGSTDQAIWNFSV